MSTILPSKLRRSFASLALLSILSLPFSAPSASPGTWIAHGPDGGFVSAIASDPADLDTVFIGSSQGIFRSLDQGEHWTPSSDGLLESQITAIAVHPVTSTLMFAGTAYGGLYKSTDGGAHWTHFTGTEPEIVPVHDPVFAIAFDPSNTETIYAATYGMPRKSQDGGSTWHDMRPVAHNFYSFAQHPLTPTTLYLGANSGLYESVDGGENWSSKGSGLATPVLAIAINPMTTTIMYAGSDSGVYRSEDSGSSWTAINDGLTYTDIRWLAVDPSDSNVVYAAPLPPFGPSTLESNLFQTVDGGEHWMPVPTAQGNPAVRSLIVSADAAHTVWVGTWGGGVFNSVDQGETWTQCNQGIVNSGVLSIELAPNDPQAFYVGTEGAGVFMSPDAGLSWMSATEGITATQVYDLAIDPTTPTTVFAAGNDGLFKSLDSGGNWSVYNAGLDTTTFYQPFPLQAIAIHPLTPSVLYLGANTGVYTSTNGGHSWSRSSTGMQPEPKIAALLIDPAAPETIYAGGEVGVYKSLNGALSWAEVVSGMASVRVRALAFDPVNSSTLYAGTYDDGVYKTNNGGNHWEAVNAGLPANQNGSRFIAELVISPTSPHWLYAALQDLENPHDSDWAGVYRSINGGASWSPLNNGLSDTKVESMALHPTAPFRLYAGSFGGGLSVFELPRVFLTFTRR